MLLEVIGNDHSEKNGETKDRDVTGELQIDKLEESLFPEFLVGMSMYLKLRQRYSSDHRHSHQKDSSDDRIRNGG